MYCLHMLFLLEARCVCREAAVRLPESYPCWTRRKTQSNVGTVLSVYSATIYIVAKLSMLHAISTGQHMYKVALTLALGILAAAGGASIS